MENSNLQKPQNKKVKLRYSLLTFVLLICIIELIVSNVQNISKNIHYAGKIKGLENKRNEELSKNKQLKSEIENYNSKTTMESIARNNLKMAEKDEILIIISKPNVTEEKQEDSKKRKKKI